jgi:hypothetical protein
MGPAMMSELWNRRVSSALSLLEGKDSSASSALTLSRLFSSINLSIT